MIFWEVLQFETAVAQLHTFRTFHIDLHPPTYAQLKTPTINVLHLSDMQFSKSIGNHIHIGINKNTCLGYVAPKPWR